MKIWANTVVCNEDKFIWFAVMSVVDYVDKILIWDTGSTDKTVEIIKEIQKIKGNKISFKEVGPVDKYQFTTVRQKMLEESKCDWILILDGDEIWWIDSIKRLTETIKQHSKTLEAIVVPMVVAVGDIYHYQPQSAGRYEILGKKGHYNLRAFNKKIPGLHVEQPYGSEGYFDNKNISIQERSKVEFLDAPYLHVSHLVRSSSSRKYNKFKYELGETLPKNFSLPEIFFEPTPSIVSNHISNRSLTYIMRASIETILKKMKRKVLSN